MRQARAREEEIQLEVEKRLKFQGTARIGLHHLNFPRDDAKGLHRKNVDRLKAIYQQHGCRRLEVQHHIPAIVDEGSLNVAIAAAGISPTTLARPPTADGYPELVLPNGHRLECLHGRHRIQAGKEFLPARDQWWTVDLYLTGMMELCLVGSGSADVRFARCQPGAENMPHRGVLQRGEAWRWRNLPEDSSIPLSAEFELRESLVGPTHTAWKEKSQGAPPSSGADCCV